MESAVSITPPPSTTTTTLSPTVNALGSAANSLSAASSSFPITDGLCPTGGCVVAAFDPFLISYTKTVTNVTMTATVIPVITEYDNGTEVTSLSTKTPYLNATGIATDIALLTWEYLNVTLTYPTTYGVFTDLVGGLDGFFTEGGDVDSGPATTICTPADAVLVDPRTTDLASFILPATALDSFPQQLLNYIATLPEVTPHFISGAVSSNPASCEAIIETAIETSETATGAPPLTSEPPPPPPPEEHTSVALLVEVTGSPIRIKGTASAVVPNNNLTPGGGGVSVLSGEPQLGGGNSQPPPNPGLPNTVNNNPPSGGNGQQPQAPNAPTTTYNQPLASGGVIVAEGGSTITVPPFSGGTTTPPVLTLGSATITANPTGGFVVAPGTTLTPGGTATVDGTVVSLSPGGTVAVVGSSTITLAGTTGLGVGGYVASGMGITPFEGGAATERGAPGRGLVWVLGVAWLVGLWGVGGML